MRPTFVTTTQAVDTAFYVILGICGVMLAGVFVAMVWFVWRYNRKRQPLPLSQKDKNLWLEIIWTTIPTILVMLMFWYGWEGYLSLRRIPDNALEIKATARMWSWLFTYGNGKTADKLYVPAGQPVKIRLESLDVLHSFFVPAFRVKRDTVPGMVNWVWFVAERPGSYDLFCAEYCGVGHSAMVTTVEALPPAEFSAWLTAVPASTDAGKSLLQKHGCLGCHSLDGSRMVGPTLQGIAGRKVEVLVAGTHQTRVVDRDYLKESILEPEKAIVVGFPPAMPTFQGRISDAELTDILDYLQTLSANNQQPEEDHSRENRSDNQSEGGGHLAGPTTPPAPAKPKSLAARGADLGEKLGCLGCHSTDGSRRVGPSFKGLFGHSQNVTRNGQEVQVLADKDFIKRSIREPAAEIALGYPPAMPPFAQLSDADIDAITAWLETLE